MNKIVCIGYDRNDKLFKVKIVGGMRLGCPDILRENNQLFYDKVNILYFSLGKEIEFFPQAQIYYTIR